MGATRRALMLAPAVLGAAYVAPVAALSHLGRSLFPAVVRLPVKHAVSLTFDDGPDRSLDAFLTTLDRAEAKATFFVTGEQVERGPERLREIVAAGHEVGVHGYQHRDHLRLAPWQVAADLRRGRATIEDAIGRPAGLFRPPQGHYSLASWREAGRQGWARVLWSRCGRDWESRATPRSIADHVGIPAPGDIIVLHDSDRYSPPGSWRNTLDALPLIFERLAAAGLVSRPVGELLGTVP